MFAKTFQRSFWLAYREQLGIAAAVTGLLALLLTMALTVFDIRLSLSEGGLAMLFAGFPAIFLLTSTVLFIAHGKDQETFDGLRLTGASWIASLAGRWAFALIVAVCHFTMVIAIVWLVDSDMLSRIFLKTVVLSKLTGFEAMVWGLLATAWLKTTGRAFTLAVAGLIGTSGLLTVVYYGLGIASPTVELTDITSFYLVRTVLAVIVMLTALRATSTAFRLAPEDATDGASEPEPSRWSISQFLPSSTASSTARHSVTHHRLRAFSVIARQELRHKWMLGVLLFGFVTLLLSITTDLDLKLFEERLNDTGREVSELFANELRIYEDEAKRLRASELQVVVGLLIVSSVIVGASTFRLDLKRSHYRYFETMGISIRQLWHSRMIVSCALWLAFVLAFLAWCTAFHFPTETEYFPWGNKELLPSGQTVAGFIAAVIVIAAGSYVAGLFTASLGRSLIILSVASVVNTCLLLLLYVLYESSFESMTILKYWAVVVLIAVAIALWVGWRLNTSRPKGRAILAYVATFVVCPIVVLGVMGVKYANDFPQRPIEGDTVALNSRIFEDLNGQLLRQSNSQVLQDEELAFIDVVAKLHEINKTKEREFNALRQQAIHRRWRSADRRAAERQAYNQAQIKDLIELIKSSHRGRTIQLVDVNADLILKTIREKYPPNGTLISSPVNLYESVQLARESNLIGETDERIEFGFALLNIAEMAAATRKLPGTSPYDSNHTLAYELIYEGCLEKQGDIEFLEDTRARLKTYEDATTDRLFQRRADQIYKNLIENEVVRYQRDNDFQIEDVSFVANRIKNRCWAASQINTEIYRDGWNLILAGDPNFCIAGRDTNATWNLELITPEDHELLERLRAEGSRVWRVDNELTQQAKHLLEERAQYLRLSCLIYKSKFGELPSSQAPMLVKGVLQEPIIDPFTGWQLRINFVRDADLPYRDWFSEKEEFEFRDSPNGNSIDSAGRWVIGSPIEHDEFVGRIGDTLFSKRGAQGDGQRPEPKGRFWGLEESRDGQVPLPLLFPWYY